MDVNDKSARNQSIRMRELIDLLNRASEAYYAKDEELMSNFEYDRLYDELVQLERTTGVTMADSPTVRVGYESVDELPKERHERPMLSLDKTKSREELQGWLGVQKGVLSWKLDGLTVVLTYENGALVKAVTRGNGEIGEVITGNARAFKNIPLTIPFKGKLILRGEAVIRYSDFEKINRQLEEAVQYKNPRNLCSGSVRQLSSEVTAKRNVRFYAFALVVATDNESKKTGEAVDPAQPLSDVSVPDTTLQPDFHNSMAEQLRFLAGQGFETVEHVLVDRDSILPAIEDFERKIQHYDIPSDGLVLMYDDLAYGASLGTTAKFPRNGMAFKWADELQETTLREIEWSASRTGLINPVAIFDPVELEGTTVKRASVHNVSQVKMLHLGIGDRITVYKANMIIPQIAENLTGSDALTIPDRCPVCDGRTEIRAENEAEALYCTNPECPAKKLKSFALFTSRNAMNIEGLSEMTLEKLIAQGWLHELADIYHLSEHRAEFVELEGFGEKSFEKLMDGIEASRHTTLARLIYALGIPGIGASNARLLARHFEQEAMQGNTKSGQGDAENTETEDHASLPGEIAALSLLRIAGEEELSQIEGIGPVLADAIHDWFWDEKHLSELGSLLKELTIEQLQRAVLPGNLPGVTPGRGNGSDDGQPGSGDAQSGMTAASPIAGKTFVITGAVHHFANRDELKVLIEDLGGKAAGSVSSKTDYLINNDVTSTSGKNKKAKELGIPIISEEEFLQMMRGEVSVQS